MAIKTKTTSLKELHEAQRYEQQRNDAAAIAFVVLAEAGALTTSPHPNKPASFPNGRPMSTTPWASSGSMRQVYRCVQAHTSQTGWEPPNAASLLHHQ